MPVSELSMQETNWIEMQSLLHIALFFEKMSRVNPDILPFTQPFHNKTPLFLYSLF